MKLRIPVAVLAAFALVACGQAASSNNQADVEFASGMVPHHRQAVEMADLISARSDNPKLISFGERVRETQLSEIDTMTGWLKRWGASEPASHSGHAMPGMMTPQQMADLKAAKGVAFDKMWLRMMLERQKGVDMARTALAKGSDPEAKKLAKTIVDAQQNEIDEINVLLAEG